MLVSSSIRRCGRNGERGYVLLTLMLVVAIAAIVFLFGVAPNLKFSIKRDREEEMIHRGVQYTRAIQAYYRKFNRYPSKIEDLENTNQLRFLRKRYKDPITGKDFRLLHYGEAKIMGSGMMGSSIPGAMTVGANGQFTPQNGPQTTSFGGNSGGFGGSFGQSSNSTFGQNSNSGYGQNSQNAETPGDSSGAANGQDASNGSNSTGNGSGSTTGGSGFGTQLGGAPIVGVASLSKDPTIREFDKKKKYNEWQFVYDPMMDRGGLIRTPYQQQLMTPGVGQSVQNMNGQNGTSPNGSGFGNSFGNNNNSGFGNSFGNSPGGMQNTPSPTPSQPSNPPQQQ